MGHFIGASTRHTFVLLLVAVLLHQAAIFKQELFQYMC